MDMHKASTISIAAWNINGLSNKLDDEYFCKYVCKYDCIILTETWLGKELEPHCIADYIPFSKTRQKAVNAKRNSGGISVLLKPNIRKGVKYIDTNNDYCIWMKFDRTYFGLDKDIFLCACYIPPEGSNIYKQNQAKVNPFNIIEDEIMKYKQKGNVLLMGDLNARSGVLDDFVDKDNDDRLEIYSKCSHYQHDTALSKRTNSDVKHNVFGKNLINMCKILQMRILNGRTIGDIKGNITYMHPSGCSAIDYAVADQDLMSQVVCFKVNEICYLSDHALISAYIKINNVLKIDKQSKGKYEPAPIGFTWTSESKSLFKKALSVKLDSNKGEQTQPVNIDSQMEIDKLEERISSLLIDTADQVLVRRKKGDKQKRLKSSKWFNNPLHEMKRNLIRLGKQLIHYNGRQNMERDTFFSLKKKYKRAVRVQKRKYKQDLLDKITYMEDRNPKIFWQLLKDLKGNKQNETGINIQTWENYFRNLGDVKHSHNNKFDNKVDEWFKHLMSKTNQVPVLDEEIKDTEIMKQISKLKIGKSTGADNISNEMIKYGIEPILPYILKLFNEILNNEIVPNRWGLGHIVPIFKSGAKSDPSNYRGITLSSCLGKLFNKILNERLVLFLDRNGLLCKEQIGFRQGSRTADHIFVLKSIVEYYKTKKQPIYCCFIDLRRAFDSVWRIGLFYKLLKTGVGVKLVSILKDLYIKTNNRVKVGWIPLKYVPITHWDKTGV